jgi:CheY-like chemotaxis protein
MNSRQKTILIADDNADILDMLTLFLEDCGYQVQAATDAASLFAFPHGLPDLLLLDIWLAGRNGGEICRQLKSQQETCHLPILLVSANRETEAIAREAGADSFVLKPFDLDALLEAVEHYLSSDAVS